MKIPFLDLKAQYQSIKHEIDDAIQQVLESCAFAGGPFVQEFERQFAEFCGCGHCVGAPLRGNHAIKCGSSVNA